MVSVGSWGRQCGCVWGQSFICFYGSLNVIIFRKEVFVLVFPMQLWYRGKLMVCSVPSHGHNHILGGGLVKWRSCLSLRSDLAAWPHTQTPLLVASWPWVSRSPSLSFPFLICKRGWKRTSHGACQGDFTFVPWYLSLWSAHIVVFTSFIIYLLIPSC